MQVHRWLGRTAVVMAAIVVMVVPSRAARGDTSVAADPSGLPITARQLIHDQPACTRTDPTAQTDPSPPADPNLITKPTASADVTGEPATGSVLPLAGSCLAEPERDEILPGTKAPPTRTSGPGEPPPSLAATGTDVGSMLVLGTSLVVAGALLLIVRRRRDRDSGPEPDDDIRRPVLMRRP